VVGVRCLRTLADTLAQSVGSEYAIALVATNGELFAEFAATELIELAHAGLGHVLTYFLSIKNYTGAQYIHIGHAIYMLVIPLSAYAKIIAENGDGTL